MLPNELMPSIVGKYLYIYPPDRNESAISTRDVSLIKILEISEMTEVAGWLIKFDLIAGDYTKSVKDTVSTENGVVGKIGYVQINHLKEQLNKPNKYCEFLQLGENLKDNFNIGTILR